MLKYQQVQRQRMSQWHAKKIDKKKVSQRLSLVQHPPPLPFSGAQSGETLVQARAQSLCSPWIPAHTLEFQREAAGNWGRAVGTGQSLSWGPGRSGWLQQLLPRPRGAGQAPHSALAVPSSPEAPGDPGQFLRGVRGSCRPCCPAGTPAPPAAGAPDTPGLAG